MTTWRLYNLINNNNEVIYTFGICDNCNHSKQQDQYTHFELKEFIIAYIERQLEMTQNDTVLYIIENLHN